LDNGRQAIFNRERDIPRCLMPANWSDVIEAKIARTNNKG
jgi:hypothetical protein